MVGLQGPGRAGDPPAGGRAEGRHGVYRQRATSPNCSANSRFRRVTGAGLRESHVHDVAISREAPNYRQD